VWSLLLEVIVPVAKCRVLFDRYQSAHCHMMLQWRVTRPVTALHVHSFESESRSSYMSNIWSSVPASPRTLS